MPTVDRVSLRSLIDSPKRLDELGVARVIANVAEVVHKRQKGGQPLGTVTPEAIIISADGEISLDPREGKPGYTAPETLRGEAGDRRSDVFALGAILWEALAHEPLFQGEIDSEIKAAVLEGEYRSASETNANVPAELDAICKKALSRTPADRYPSCKVMAAEIATVLDDADYPDDNGPIAEYLQQRYVAAAPKPAPKPTSRPTPIPAEPQRPATQTLQGVSPRAEIEAAMAKAAAQADPKQTLIAPTGDPRKKTPSAGGLPAWAMARPAREVQPPPMSEQPADPATTLPGAPAMLNTPPAAKTTFSKTAVLGSLSSADLVPPAEPEPPPATSAPAVPVGKKTEVHGSASLADRLAAINVSAGKPAVPGLPAVPPGADLPPPNITTAETVATPAVTPPPAPEATLPPTEAVAMAATVTQAPEPVVIKTPSEAVAMPAAATGTAVASDDSAVHPASVVALPRARSKSEAGRDPVAGWGWGTGPHETVPVGDDDDYYEDQRKTKKRLVMAIGGAAAAVTLVIVAALAFGDDSEGDKKPTETVAKQTEPAVDWSQPTPAPADDPGSAVEPTAGSADEPSAGSADEPNAGSADEPPATEPPQPEVAATEPPQPEPPKPAPKPEPKPEPKVVKKEPKREPKPEPKAAKTERKRQSKSWDPMARRPNNPKPVDPYAEKKPSVDASAAYRTGIQQFARGDANGALSTFKASLAANPNFAPTWRGIGMVYEKLGRRSQAKTAFRRYLQLSPRAGDAAQIRERMERL